MTAPDGRQRLLGSLALLAALYVAVILAGDARAASGSDAGGKAATVAMMVERADWDPDVGYWAADADPDGVHHPLIKTTKYGDRWVQVTSLPMLLLARPLWSLGGPTTALVLPALGGIAAAWGARRLAIVLGATDGWFAFWAVGAGSPMVFYIADLWEHAVALGLFVAALPALLDPRPRHAAALVAAGACVGAAVALRAELGLYAVALAVAGLAVAPMRDRWWGRVVPLGAAGFAALVVFVGNSLLERALLAQGIQSSRVGEQLQQAGGSLGQRASDAALTTFGLFPGDDPSVVAVGALTVGGLAALGVALGRTGRVESSPWFRFGALASVLGVVLRLAAGPGFVPGTGPATPMAPSGVAESGRDPMARVVAGAALGAMPLVWLVQWQGDLLAQWGGRYTLCSGVLLTVVASVGIERDGWRRPAALVVCAAAVVVSALGVAWHVERTNAVAAAFEHFDEHADDTVYLTTFGHLPREGGAWYTGQRWLRTSPDDLGATADVAERMGADRIALVEPADGDEVAPEELGSFVRTSEESTAWLAGTSLLVTTYEKVAQ